VAGARGRSVMAGAADGGPRESWENGRRL
jgi:hypothetical protein